MAEKKAMVDAKHPILSISRQCDFPFSFLLSAATAKEKSLRVMEEIDKLYVKYSFFGTRKMTAVFKEQSYQVNRKRVKRLLS